MKLKPEQQNVLIDKAVAGEKVSAKPEAKRIARAAKEEALGEATRRSIRGDRHQTLQRDLWQIRPGDSSPTAVIPASIVPPTTTTRRWRLTRSVR